MPTTTLYTLSVRNRDRSRSYIAVHAGTYYAWSGKAADACRFTLADAAAARAAIGAEVERRCGYTIDLAVRPARGGVRVGARRMKEVAS